MFNFFVQEIGMVLVREFWNVQNQDGVGERVLERPIHKIILFQEAEV